MPYMERLTWGGIALHAGGLPGYPESHGCIHLPSEFAKLLFNISSTGMTVVIANDSTAPERGRASGLPGAGQPRRCPTHRSNTVATWRGRALAA